MTVINFFRYQKLRFKSIGYSKIISSFSAAIKFNKSRIENEPHSDKQCVIELWIWYLVNYDVCCLIHFVQPKITSINLEKLIYCYWKHLLFKLRFDTYCHKMIYFLIHATQKKIVLLVFNSSSKRDKENSSIRLVKSSSHVKLRYSAKY